MVLLDVKDLRMHYEVVDRGWVKAVDGVSLTLKKGESLGIVGESGCGKTSLAITIMRLLPNNAKILGGEVLLDGADLIKMSDNLLRKEIRWKRMSIVFQGAMNALNPVMRIGNQIAEAITSHEPVDKKDAFKGAQKILELVGIDPERAADYPFEFSGGMRQRAMIAMALALNPDVLIADEPTTALDVIMQAQVLMLIKRLQGEFDLSLLLISHDISMITEMCGKIAVMYAGEIIECAPSIEIYQNARHPYTQGLIGAVPSIRGAKRRIKSIPGSPPNLLSPPKGCRFHPRCSLSRDECTSKKPIKFEFSSDHYVYCHRALLEG